MNSESFDFLVDRVRMDLKITLRMIAEVTSNPKEFLRIEAWIQSCGYVKKTEDLKVWYEKSRSFYPNRIARHIR